MTVYLVKHGPYRGRRTGERFEAHLPDAVEQRALMRGTLEIVEVSKPALLEGSYRLPPVADAAEKGTGADAHQSPDQGRRPDSA